MTLKKGIEVLCQNFIFYLAGLLVILGIKCYYRQADCDSLLWILAPTAWWVELLSKIPFTYISGAGYVNNSLRMVIAPSCSGIRFMTITFATLFFSFVHIIVSGQESPVSKSSHVTDLGSMKFGMPDTKALAKGLGWVAVSSFLSWMFTVFANGLRIIIAIYLPLYLEAAGLMKGILTQDRLHTMIGVAVYFIALLTIYRLVEGFISKMGNRDFPVQKNYTDFRNLTNICPDACEKHFPLTFLRKCVPPVFWYFVLTLGLPFFNRGNRNGTAEFMEFAVLVTGCCVLILLPYVIILFFRRQK